MLLGLISTHGSHNVKISRGQPSPAGGRNNLTPAVTFGMEILADIFMSTQ